MARRKFFIKRAIRHKGALTRKAHRAGMSVGKFCERKHKGRTAKQCNLFKLLRRFQKRPLRRIAARRKR